jgi:LuxR family transcriptional regulator
MECWDRNQPQYLVSERSIDEVFDDFKSSAAHLGFNRCSILVFSTETISSRPLLSKNNWPDRWNEHFQSQYGYQNNRIIECCQHSLLPVQWNKQVFDTVPGLWEDLCLFGLAHGVSQSVRDHRGFTSVFSFVQDESATNIKHFYEQMGLILWLINRTHKTLIDQLLPAVSFFE